MAVGLLNRVYETRVRLQEGKRGAVVLPEPGKTRITIRLDNEILDPLRKRVYQWAAATIRPSSMRRFASTFGAVASRPQCAGRYEKSYEGPALSKQLAAEHVGLPHTL
jgi:hypothetical protein